MTHFINFDVLAICNYVNLEISHKPIFCYATSDQHNGYCCRHQQHVDHSDIHNQYVDKFWLGTKDYIVNKLNEYLTKVNDSATLVNKCIITNKLFSFLLLHKKILVKYSNFAITSYEKLINLKNEIENNEVCKQLFDIDFYLRNLFNGTYNDIQITPEDDYVYDSFDDEYFTFKNNEIEE